MDIADTGFDQSDKKGRWQKGYDTLMSWAKRKMLEGGSGNRPNKNADVNMNQLGPDYGTSGYGKGQYGMNQMGPYMMPYNPGMFALGKGYKGGGKGYGQQKGWQPQEGYKGGGKGQYGTPGKGYGQRDTTQEKREKAEEKGHQKDRLGGRYSTENVTIADSSGTHREHALKTEKDSKGIAILVEFQGIHGFNVLNSHMGKEREEKGGLNSLDGSEEQMNLGGGEERQEDQEPEREKGSEDNTEGTAYAGMNQFAALSQDWNEDYNTGPLDYITPTWGWSGMYTL